MLMLWRSISMHQCFVMIILKTINTLWYILDTWAKNSNPLLCARHHPAQITLWQKWLFCNFFLIQQSHHHLIITPNVHWPPLSHWLVRTLTRHRKVAAGLGTWQAFERIIMWSHKQIRITSQKFVLGLQTKVSSLFSSTFYVNQVTPVEEQREGRARSSPGLVAGGRGWALRTWGGQAWTLGWCWS